MLILEAGEICPYGMRCPYNNSGAPCHGTLSSRMNRFECKFVKDGKILKDAGTRIPGDRTGNMKIIME